MDHFLDANPSQRSFFRDTEPIRINMSSSPSKPSNPPYPSLLTTWQTKLQADNDRTLEAKLAGLETKLLILERHMTEHEREIVTLFDGLMMFKTISVIALFASFCALMLM